MRLEVAVESVRDALFAASALERLKLEAPEIVIVLCLQADGASEYLGRLSFIDEVSDVAGAQAVFLTKDRNAAFQAELRVRELMAEDRAKLVDYLGAVHGLSPEEVELRFEEKLPKLTPLDSPPSWHLSQWFSFILSNAAGVDALLHEPKVTLYASGKVRKAGRSKLWSLGHKRPFVLVEAGADEALKSLEKELLAFGKAEVLREEDIKPSLLELVGMTALDECRAVITRGGVAGAAAGGVDRAELLYYAVGRTAEDLRWEGIPSPGCRYFLTQKANDGGEL